MKVFTTMCLLVTTAAAIHSQLGTEMSRMGAKVESTSASRTRSHKGTAFSDDFESGGSDWVSYHTSGHYCGTECAGGTGCCWEFTSCVGAGDVFHQIELPTECAASPCTLTYDYKGRVLAGLDADGVKGSSHTWYPYDSNALPSTSAWTTRTITGITQSGWHLMLETYGGVECASYMDNIVVTTDAIAPTPAPVPSGGTSGTSAVGDPHLQNVLGQRFDLMKPGTHVLINIPRGRRKSALLRVQADARRMGGQCADMYFQEVNITGEWVQAKGTGGLRFQAQGVRDEQPKWMEFGKVHVKVAHGHTQDGVQYLNLYVKHLGHSGFAVGGLLGEDDHMEAAMPSEACAHKLSLLQLSSQTAPTASVFSVAEASFA